MKEAHKDIGHAGPTLFNPRVQKKPTKTILGHLGQSHKHQKKSDPQSMPIKPLAH